MNMFKNELTTELKSVMRMHNYLKKLQILVNKMPKWAERKRLRIEWKSDFLRIEWKEEKAQFVGGTENDV